MTAPRWRRAYDTADRLVTPRLEELVRTPGFAQGAALLRRVEALSRSAARDVSARAWHLLNLPAGSDVHRLRAQIGQLDREVRRLTARLETERTAGNQHRPVTMQEEIDAQRPESADGPGTRPPRRRAQRSTGS
jgi:hypothetical protein